MRGAFGFTTPKDILGKLERELLALRSSPNNSDIALNFFVTAEHMLDWLYPGNVNRKVRESLRNSEPLLQVVSHIASSAKHFDQLSSHHQSVESAGESSGHFHASFFRPSYFNQAWFRGGHGLSIKFKGDAVKQFGNSLPVLEMAENVYSFWQARC